MSDELESSVLGVLERHGPQPKHALVSKLNEGRIVQVDHSDLRDALLGLERSQRVIWDSGVVRLPGSQSRLDVGEDDPWRSEQDPDEWISETLDEESGEPVEGPEVSQDPDEPAPSEAGWFLVATEWSEVRARSPQEAADAVLGDEEQGADRVVAIERDLVDQYERAVVTRRVESRRVGP